MHNSYNDSKDYLDFLVKNNVFITKEELGNRSLIDGNVLNHNLDWSMLNNTYNTLGYVVIDNFLNGLRQIHLEHKPLAEVDEIFLELAS